jgi:Uma2 family endonuclease
MAVQTRPYTIEEFDQIVMQPENAERRLQYIGGDIVEVVSNNYSSQVAARILIRLGVYVESKDLGHVTGADGGYRVAGERYIPDVAFISKTRQPEASHEVYNPNAPDLAVEVLSPSDKPDDMRLKIANYLAAGTLVWVVEPEAKTVEVYTPGQKARRIRVAETLDGGAVLPGFALVVKDIFPE